MKNGVMLTETVQAMPTRLLMVLSMLPNLPSRPRLTSEMGADGLPRYKIRYTAASPEAEPGPRKRRSIYIGELTPEHKELLMREVEHEWPQSDVVGHEQRIAELRERRASLLTAVRTMAVQCGCYLRGYRLVITPEIGKCTIIDLTTLSDMLGALCDMHMELWNTYCAMSEAALRSPGSVSARSALRTMSAVNALVSATKKTAQAMVRVGNVLRTTGLLDDESSNTADNDACR